MCLNSTIPLFLQLNCELHNIKIKRNQIDLCRNQKQGPMWKLGGGAETIAIVPMKASKARQIDDF